eukprot:g2384.t1
MRDMRATDAEYWQFGLFVALPAAVAVYAIIHMAFVRSLRRRFPAKERMAQRPSPGSLLDVAYTDGLLGNDVITGTVAPVAGMVVCLLFTLRFNFYSTVRVEGRYCNPGGVQTPQFMPSISASIGDHAPQRYIWRICICFMIVNRLRDGRVQHGMFRNAFARRAGAEPLAPQPLRFRLLNGAVHALHTLENLCLVLLSYVSSSDYFPAHMVGFVGFAVANVLHMGATMALMRSAYGDDALSASARDGLAAVPALCWRWRLRCMVANYALIAAAAYLYVRHEARCEPYVYSLFGVCEWSFVVTNILFLMAIYAEAPHYRLLAVDDAAANAAHYE